MTAIPEVDPRLEHTKELIFKSFVEKYAPLIDLIQTLAINPACKGNAIMNINQGFLWVKEGIGSLMIKFEEVQEDNGAVFDVA